MYVFWSRPEKMRTETYFSTAVATIYSTQLFEGKKKKGSYSTVLVQEKKDTWRDYYYYYSTVRVAISYVFVS
jgi:hypothetical protein